MDKKRNQPRRKVKILTTKKPIMNPVSRQTSASKGLKIERPDLADLISDIRSPIAGSSGLQDQVQAETQTQQNSDQDTSSTSDKLVEESVKMLHAYQLKMREDEINELFDRIEKLEEKVKDYKTFLSNLEFVLKERSFSTIW